MHTYSGTTRLTFNQLHQWDALKTLDSLWVSFPASIGQLKGWVEGKQTMKEGEKNPVIFHFLMETHFL